MCYIVSMSGKVVKKWGQIEEEQLLNGIASNMSDEDIAKDHNRSVGAIAIRRKVVGVKLLKEGEDIDVVSRRVRVPKEELLRQMTFDEQKKNNVEKKLQTIKKKLEEIITML